MAVHDLYPIILYTFLCSHDKYCIYLGIQNNPKKIIDIKENLKMNKNHIIFPAIITINFWVISI